MEKEEEKAAAASLFFFFLFIFFRFLRFFSCLFILSLSLSLPTLSPLVLSFLLYLRVFFRFRFITDFPSLLFT